MNRSRPRWLFGRRAKGAVGVFLAAGLAALATMAAPASAATTTIPAATTLSGNSVLASEPFNETAAGVTASGSASITMHWNQPASIATEFDPNLVRQGRSLDPQDSYTRSSPGKMSVDYGVSFSVAWDGISVGPFTPSFTTKGDCNLRADTGNYLCHLDSDQVGILDYPVPCPACPFVKLKLVSDVTVTPEGLATLRSATFGGNPDGTANLSLGESPITDALAIPCTVGKGDDLTYTLGQLSSTPGISMVTKLEFDVGITIPNPFFPIGPPNGYATFASPSIPIGTTTGSIGMTGAGASFDLGAVQANNIPPSSDAGGPYAGNEGSPISFDGSGSSSICGFPTLRWDFSDGGVGFGKFPQHTFTDNGTYSGLLTATDPTGLSSTTTFSVVVNNVAPSVNAGPDTTADWGRPVAFNGQATDPGSSDQPTLQYTWDFGDGSPSASGGPSVIHSYSTPGSYNAVLMVCDKDENPLTCPTDARTVHVTKRDTTTAYLGDTAGTFDTPASLSASLVDEYGQAVNSRSIAFQVGTDGPLSSLTNSSGTATKSYTPTLAAGSYSGSAAFNGALDALYNSSNSSNGFVVSLKGTTMLYTGAVTGGPNKTVVLSAVLKDATGKPLQGRTVNFQLGTQTASAVTDANGIASTSLKLNQKNGTYTVSATWTPAGVDATHYTGSTQGVVFKLQSK